jgi:hypothetical protein
MGLMAKSAGAARARTAMRGGRRKRRYGLPALAFPEGELIDESFLDLLVRRRSRIRAERTLDLRIGIGFEMGLSSGVAPPYSSWHALMGTHPERVSLPGHKRLGTERGSTLRAGLK